LRSEDFTERGLPLSFVADLRAKIAAYRVATSLKLEGRADLTAATAGAKAAAAAGMKAVRALRLLMRVHLRSNPALLSAWKLAARVERPSKSARTVSVATKAVPPIEVLQLSAAEADGVADQSEYSNSRHQTSGGSVSGRAGISAPKSQHVGGPTERPQWLAKEEIERPAVEGHETKTTGVIANRSSGTVQQPKTIEQESR
jgi:hypothetical protein